MLHIGPPKTGTTALQAAFHAARRDADRQGVHYAGTGRHSMSAVLAGIDKPSPWNADGRPPKRILWQRLLAEIHGSKAARVVLSSEFFADAGDAARQRVVGELGPERLQVVVTLRPLAALLPSQWQQYVQNRLTTSFDDWLTQILGEDPRAITPSFWTRHRHDRLIARWVEALGPDRVTVVALDDRDPAFVLRAFEDLTGLAPDTLQPVEDLSNRSMTLPEAEAIRAFNIAYRDAALPAPLYSRVMRFGATVAMRARRPTPNEPRIALPAWAVPKVGAIADEVVAGIESSGVRIVGSIEALRATSRAAAAHPGAASEGVAGSSVAVPPEVAGTMALGVVLASGLARGTAPAADLDEARGEHGPPAPRPPRPPRPIAEPPELFRISTLQLAAVLVRRGRAAVLDRIASWGPRGLVRRVARRVRRGR